MPTPDAYAVTTARKANFRKVLAQSVHYDSSSGSFRFLIRSFWIRSLSSLHFTTDVDLLMTRDSPSQSRFSARAQVQDSLHEAKKAAC